jgi:hypothetical protein
VTRRVLGGEVRVALPLERAFRLDRFAENYDACFEWERLIADATE